MCADFRKQLNNHEKTAPCMKHEAAKVQGGGTPKRAYPTRP